MIQLFLTKKFVKIFVVLVCAFYKEPIEHINFDPCFLKVSQFVLNV